MDDSHIVNESDSLSVLPNLEVEIDWEAYFKSFAEAHGKWPVLYNNGTDDSLLFQDGWRYSAYSYDGPEYPPPTDKQQLDTLKRYYWERRYKIVRNEARELEIEITRLSNLQHSKNQPLPQRVTYRDDEGHNKVATSQINFRILNQRLDWLKADMIQCMKELKKLNTKDALAG